MIWDVVSQLFYHPVFSSVAIAILALGIYSIVKAFAGNEGLLKARKVCASPVEYPLSCCCALYVPILFSNQPIRMVTVFLPRSSWDCFFFQRCL